MLFSQRHGFKPVKTVIQIDSMDDDLRHGLWNILAIHYWEQRYYSQGRTSDDSSMLSLFRSLWHSYFKKPLDTLPEFWSTALKEVREYFYKCEWYEVYDFIEFVANNYPLTARNKDFIRACNAILKQEVSAYQFVGERIARLTSEEEIAEIETALRIPGPLGPIKDHLRTALDKLADRKSPDYRNSIKESISAVCFAGEKVIHLGL